MKANGHPRVLLVDDDETFRKVLAGALRRRGHEVITAEGGSEALQLAEREGPEVAVLDLRMPGLDGIELMEALRRTDPDLQVIILTGHGTIPSAIDSIRRGASNYLLKPCEVDEVESAVRSALRQHDLERENRQLKAAIQHATPYEGIVGDSPQVHSVIDLIERAKESWSPVLIQGESGTGKELVARALHNSSSRSEHPFVTVNCAGLKPELLENELFGHVEGAFTGASRTKGGLFEVADAGTLFIDEIADMNLAVQAGLLRVVETGVFRPLGSTREKSVQVRIVAAANRDLHDEVVDGRFRQDLLYRLDVVHIEIPPLRERAGDIPLLVESYLTRSREAREKQISLQPTALELLESYPWPGNVRELFHVLERAILLSKGGALAASDLDAVLRPRRGFSAPGPGTPTLLEKEKRYIEELLRREDGNVSRVSGILGIDRRTLQRKMKRHGIVVER